MSSTIKKILILAANPKNSSPLRLDQEVREINDALKLARNRDDFEVIQQWAVRPRDMQRAVLESEPRIVHFSGHGMGEGGLALEDNAGQVKLVSADALAAMFELCADQVECVLLNACYSDVQAEAIAQHIPYVIGMNEAVGDRAALEFSIGFYDGLGAGRSIEYAFKAGCISIQLAGIPEHLTPVLKRRSDLAQSRPIESSLVESHDVSLEMPEGQVGIDSSFYIPSSYEERCYEEIEKAGSLIRIKSPHKMGKSSLMVRVLAHAEQLGYRTINLNLEPVNQKLFTNLDQFMQWFCASVGKSLGVRVKTEDYWDDIFGANDNSTDYFEKYLLEGSEQPLVLAIDNFDRVFSHPDIETDFCGLLRGWHERSRSHKLWGKLRLIIVYSQEPYLQKDINQSPFNVGLPIELGEFTVAQVQALVMLHELDWTERMVAQVIALVGGHPYLVRSALYHIAVGDLSLETFLRTAPTEAGIYQDHLVGHLKALENYPELEAAVKTVVTAEAPVRLRSEEAFKLDSMGLVVRVNNDVQPRCQLYRQYFRDRLGV